MVSSPSPGATSSSFNSVQNSAGLSTGGTEARSGKGGKEKSKEKKGDVAARTQLRLESSGTGIGLKDWTFNAALLVKDCIEEYENNSPALQLMLESLRNAAQVLSNDNWRRFQELVWDRVHCQDNEVFGLLLSRIEPSWRTTLMTPKCGTTCVFLHLGTEPPSGALCDVFTRLGWFGVSVSPYPLESGFEDYVEHILLDPSADRDRDEFIAMTRNNGGKIPKPSRFLVIFVNTAFNPTDPEPDSDEELGVFGEEPKDKKEPEKQASWLRGNMPVSHKENSTELTSASGYGKLGVTRNPSVRKRLRALYMCLLVALNRLKHQGSLVILWPGLPCHPSLFFLTSFLRTIFMRVHVVSNEGIKTFEVYIVCASFNRTKADDPTPGEGATALMSFLGGAYRRAALDDVLLWTLTACDEKGEASFGVGGKSKCKTHEDLWNTMAAKYKALAVDLDMDVTKGKKGERDKKDKLKKKEDSAGVSDHPAKSDKEPASPASEVVPKAVSKAKPIAESVEIPVPKESSVKAAQPKAKATSDPHAAAKAPIATTVTPSTEKTALKPATKSSSKPTEKTPLKPPPSKNPSKSPRLVASPVASPRPADEGQKETASTKAAPHKATTPQQPPPITPQQPPVVLKDTDTGGDATKEKSTTDQNAAVKDALEKAQLEQKSPKKRRFVLSRSVPSLSCSLGAAPGSLGATLRGPNREVMSSTFDLIRFGHLCAEHKIQVRKWHRKRESVGVNLADDELGSKLEHLSNLATRTN